MEQCYFNSLNYQSGLHKLLVGGRCSSLLLVCGKSAENLEIYHWLIKEVEEIDMKLSVFQDFDSNPKYESVESGIRQMSRDQCDVILAIGGGSALDVAKCIKLGCRMNLADGKLCQLCDVSPAPLIAVPTTAGTGSEATQFAVIYYAGEKQSVSHPKALPMYVVLDENNLSTLPEYQRRVTLLDALAHAIESMWSVNSCGESCGYAEQAIMLIVANMEEYVDGRGAEKELMTAANVAGKAINLTQTTAAHAMSYKLTSRYGIPHGQAVMLCLPELWEYMYAHMNQCIDIRGETFLGEQFARIAACLRKSSVKAAVEFLKQLRRTWNLDYRSKPDREEIERLVAGVNVERLRNNPVQLTKTDIRILYEQILEGE